MKKVLVVEDDKNIAELINIHLSDMECDVTLAHEGREGLLQAMDDHFDLIILDIMLPGMDGLEILKKLRADKNNTPIMMLTAKSEEIDKVLGLESGADDYLTKPFGVRELIARVKAIFRRVKVEREGGDEREFFRYGDLQIDVGKRKVVLADSRIDLTPKEFDLLTLLASHPGQTYSRDRILNLIWGYEFEGYEHTVNSHINRLRSKIEQDANKPQYILTTWGVGYRFNDEL